MKVVLVVAPSLQVFQRWSELKQKTLLDSQVTFEVRGGNTLRIGEVAYSLIRGRESAYGLPRDSEVLAIGCGRPWIQEAQNLYDHLHEMYHAGQFLKFTREHESDLW